MRPHGRPRAPERALLMSHRYDAADRVLSTLAFALFLAAWVTAYVGFVGPDTPRHHSTMARLGEVRQ